MFFLQLLGLIVSVAILVLVGYAVLNKIERPLPPVPQQELKQNNVIIVIDKFIKHTVPDVYCLETEYREYGAPEGIRSPTVVLKRFYGGDADIQLGNTPGPVQVENYGRRKIALLEKVLPDIRGQLMNKKV